MDKIRVRIAPSPTGYLHIGLARTALFNFLFAKQNDGVLVLRIEDTDLERSDAKYEKDIFEGLDWLGIAADESPKVGGPCGPYRQSERIATYRKALEKLLNEGKAFYCFHTENELEDEKKWKIENKTPLLHLCEKWRDLPLQEANKKLIAGEPAIIRFKIPREPSNKAITFHDEIRGQVHFFIRLLGDFSIAKSLDVPLYNFAVVVDDYEMQISHIIRGEEHISNTPKQLLIAEALGWAKENEDDYGNMHGPWQYAHLPLILAPDRSKLSKRHGATSVCEFRKDGYLPEALVNFMALLGWNPGNDREIFTMGELIKKFDLENVQKSGAVFNAEKLDWMNGEYIRKKSPAELTALAVPYLGDFLQFQILNDKFPIAYIEKVMTLEQPRLKKLSEIGERTDYFFREPDYSRELLKWKNMTPDDIRDSLFRSKTILENMPEDNFTVEKLQEKFLKEIGEGDKGELLWPLRAALSGKKASPGPFEIMEVLGKEKSVSRIKKAITVVTMLS